MINPTTIIIIIVIIKNIRAVREVLGILKKCGAVCLFPAAQVMAFDPMKLRITENTWSESFIYWARATNAVIIPVRFSGRNSFFFHIAGLISPVFRTALLLQETKGRMFYTAQYEILEPIEDLGAIKSSNEAKNLAERLRILVS